MCLPVKLFLSPFRENRGNTDIRYMWKNRFGPKLPTTTKLGLETYKALQHSFVVHFSLLKNDTCHPSTDASDRILSSDRNI